MRSFLIITTADLPEAYFLANYLFSRGQRIAIVNLTGRPWRQNLRIFNRLRHRRGIVYLADMLLGRAVRRVFQPAAKAFPEIDAALITRLKRQSPHLDVSDPHASYVFRFVELFEPDYILLAGTPVLKSSLYGLAKYGAMNRHLGLLPDYRGSDCPLWVLAMNHAGGVGFSIHTVAQKADAGDVIVTQPVSISPGSTLYEYLARLQRQASEGFVAVLERILANEVLTGEAQPSGGIHFPPAGFSTLRRAARNYARLAADGPGAELEIAAND